MIAFYMQFGGQALDFDPDSLNLGNPGLGGTQYLFLLTVCRLNEIYGFGTAVLYADREFTRSSPSVPIKMVSDLRAAISLAERESVDYLVVNGRTLCNANKNVIRTSPVPIVAWAHNTVSPSAERIASSFATVAGVVCVSEAQWKAMRDSRCYDKCRYINNGIPNSALSHEPLTDYSRPEVVYVGSLYPQKGVHNLLRIWRRVVAEFPDARLKIIGGAQIWDGDAKVGRMGVADPYYEVILERSLSRLPGRGSVVFLGPRSAQEIDRHVAHARVAVANPSRYVRDETFCMAALELQARGIPVVSRYRRDGLSTSIDNGISGHLAVSDRAIADRLLELLRDPGAARTLGAAALEHSRHFVIDRELHKWLDLVDYRPTGRAARRGFAISKNAVLLAHDWILKLWFHLSSGKLWSRLSKYR